MSHFARVAVAAVVSAVACSSPKPAAAPETAASESATAAPATDAAGASAPAVNDTAAVAGDATGVQTWLVADQLGACEGEGARKCLRVRNSKDEDWRNFFGVIDGFDYEPAYTYELRVEVTPIANPPADAPSLRYRLVEVVSKDKVNP
jgi:uncharacterized protein DUF4377